MSEPPSSADFERATQKAPEYTTDRNRQFNFKATDKTIDRFYKMADAQSVPLCELLEQALDALETAGAAE